MNAPTAWRNPSNTPYALMIYLLYQWGGCFHLPTELPVAALPGSHLKKNWGWHILIEIDAHIWKKIPKKVNFAAITALLEIGRWYHPPIGMQTINGLSPNGGWFHPPSKEKLDHFLYNDFHRISWEICASILITRLWLKGFFKWTAGSTRTQEAKWRYFHPPIRTPHIMKNIIPFLTTFLANVNLFWVFLSISALYPSETSQKAGIYPALLKDTCCLICFRLFSRSRSLYRDAYILSQKSAFTKPSLFGSFLTAR